MATQSNNETVRKFFDSLNAGDVEGATSLLAPEYVEHGGPPGLPPGVPGFRAFIAMVTGAFPDLHVEVHDVFGEGDRVAARVTVNGTHRGVLMGTIQPTGSTPLGKVLTSSASRMAVSWSGGTAETCWVS